MPDYMVTVDSTYRIISDDLGSVRLVVNASSGIVAQRLEYDAWGNVLTDTNQGFQPFGFAGGLYDPDTKLVRFGARDYDASVGRWTCKDPVGFAAQCSNQYEYVFSAPLDVADAAGLLVSATFDIGTKKLVVRDLDTGKSVTIGAESGGHPLGAPIPLGSYDILDFPNPDYLRLEALDSKYGDDRVEGTGRSLLRLHKHGRGINIGCIGAMSDAQWGPLRDLIRGTRRTRVLVESKKLLRIGPDAEDIDKFGTLKVIDSKPRKGR